MSSNTNDKRWATVTVFLAAEQREHRDPATLADRLAEVGAILAMDPDIDGVQTLEPRWEAVEHVALRLYTRPETIARVESEVRTITAAHGFVVDVASEERDDCDWHDLWKQFYRPLRFGHGLLLVRPSWIARTDGDPEREILLDPGRAFGTGLHPTTQLCLERLCALCIEGARPRALLDLGCGSGILGLAALRLFPALERAVALDVDPEATEIACENAEHNGLHDRLDVRTGELAATDDEPPFDLVVANIRPSVLIPLAPALRLRVAPGGRATVSGILNEEAAGVVEAYRDAGFEIEGTREHDGWTGVDLRSPS